MSVERAVAIASEAAGGSVVVVTGAGISAESGIPTFRGEEGYWQVGAREYRPEEMATSSAFERFPREVWRWYLYRRSVCRAADANDGHRAIAELDGVLRDDFVLATQNVDGLHLRAGNSAERTYEVHGNIDYMRCAARCTSALFAVPAEVPTLGRNDPLEQRDFERLRCPKCNGPSRPHVLWFDEYYDEELYRFESSLRAAASASLMITIGTSGATNLPNQMVQLAAQRGIALIDINPNDNPFARLARDSGGVHVKTGAGVSLPTIAQSIIETRRPVASA